LNGLILKLLRFAEPLTDRINLLSFWKMSSIDEIIYRQVEQALMEDMGPGDLTTLATVESKMAIAEIKSKSGGILAGLPVVEAAVTRLDEKAALSAYKQDGDSFAPGDKIVNIKADVRAILTAERTALNFLGHLSGIATLTSQFVKAIGGTEAVILDTRKTIPGLRFLEKYAVTCGGGLNHRYGLYDMALIKDNHIAAAGSITAAVDKMREFIGSEEFEDSFPVKPEDVEIEVEVTSEDQLREAVSAGVKRLLLDNQSPASLKKMVELARSLANDLELEASGNVALDNVRDIAESGVDMISIGRLTHSAPSSDFSLNIIKK